VNHTGFVTTIKLLLSNIASNYLHDRSLLMSRRSGTGYSLIYFEWHLCTSPAADDDSLT